MANFPMVVQIGVATKNLAPGQKGTQSATGGRALGGLTTLGVALTVGSHVGGKLADVDLINVKP